MSTTESVTHLSEFAALADEWNALLEKCPSNSIFLTWEWLFTRWKYLPERRHLHIVTVREQGRLIAVAPLAIRPWQFRRLLPFRTFAFLGMDAVGSDYQDIFIDMAHEAKALSELARYFSEHRLIVEFSRVKRASAQVKGLASPLAQCGWRQFDNAADVCPYIELRGETWVSYLAHLGAEHRYNVNRRLRNLSKQGTVDFIQVQTDAERIDALQLLVALHNLRWRERGGSGAFASQALRDFHDEFSRIALARGWLRLFVLRLDGKPVAVWYGFYHDSVFHFYQSGFDTQFNKFSVGLVIMALAIQRAIAEGARGLDLLLGDESYKFLWARQQSELLQLGFYPPSLRGEFYKRMILLRKRVRKLISHSVPSIN